jgi:hypothetical protein
MALLALLVSLLLCLDVFAQDVLVKNNYLYTEKDMGNYTLSSCSSAPACGRFNILSTIV